MCIDSLAIHDSGCLAGFVSKQEKPFACGHLGAVKGSSSVDILCLNLHYGACGSQVLESRGIMTMALVSVSNHTSPERVS